MQRYTDAPDSPAWHARRARCFNAGDASAMLGCHPSGVTRTQLLHALHTGIEREFSDYVQAKVIDPGHRIEALWRPIAESILGEDLQVMAGTLDVGLSRPLGASLDGLTFMEDTNGECKTANDALRAALPHIGRDSHIRNDARQLPKGYRVQMEQQQLVTGATRTLFSAMAFDAEGNPTEERHAFYVSDPALRAEIIAGWRQFDADLAAYVPTEIKERPAAEVTLALPALVIHAKGEITTSNMKEYGDALAKRLAEVRAIALVTDQDFSNAKESAKLLRDNIQQAKLAKDAMLAQTVTVGEAARMIDAWCEDMRLTALKLEQDVEREDKAKKAAMIAAARSAYDQHLEAAKAATGGPWIVLSVPDWAGAIKSKRSFASMQDALDTMLANAKIAADESARKIIAALAALDAEAKGYEHLFADRLAFITKPADDVRALVKGRIAEHRANEERRAAELAERERARIRAEEEAKAAAKVRQEQEDRDAEARRQQEAAAEAQREKNEMALQEIQGIQQQVYIATLGRAGVRKGGTIECIRETLAETEAWKIDEGNFGALTGAAQAAKDKAVAAIRQLLVNAEARAEAQRQEPVALATPAAPVTTVEAFTEQRSTVVPMRPAGPPTLTLTEINRRLGRGKWSEEDLTALGFPPAGRAGASKLWHMASLDAIFDALIAHFDAAQRQQREAA